MRPWVLMKQCGIAFEEVMVRFDSFKAGSNFKTAMAKVSPVAKVPVLVDGDRVVWDTLAIAETLAEEFPDKTLWPRDAADRARARSVCAEMHSGFAALRSRFPMNIEASLPDQGEEVLKDDPAARDDLQRIVSMWSELLETHGGPMLFGPFGIADAYFAPVCMRIETYRLPVPKAVADYIDRVKALPGVDAWIKEALAERAFVAEDEPYRSKR